MMTVKLEGLDRLKRLLDPKKVESAAVSAINRVANSTRTEASNVIRNEKGWKIKKADLDKRLSMKQARKGEMYAVLTPRRITARKGDFISNAAAGQGRDSFALPYFGAKEIKRTEAGVITTSRSKHGGLMARRQKRSKAPGGVTVQVLKGGAKAHFPKAFIAQMRSGYVGVFRRTGFFTSNDRPQIAEVKTISVLTMFRGIRRRLLEHARRRWRVEIAAQLKYQLGRKS